MLKRPLSCAIFLCLSLLSPLTQGCAGNGSNNSSTPSTPSTTATSLSPSTAVAGAGDFTINVQGANFSSTAKVYWNGTAKTTTYVSGSSLQATIAKTDVASSGTAAVYVVDGSVTTAPITFTITAPPAPTATSISPSTVNAGSGSLTLTVTGTGFDSAARVYVGSLARTTTYVSPSQLTALVLATDVAAAGTLSITVQDAGTTTTALPLTVVTPPLAITSISPSSATAGSGAVSLTVTGTSFAQGSSVLFGPTTLQTTYNSSTSLLATIPANLLLQSNTIPVTVLSPGAGNGTQTSNVSNFAINPLPSGTFITDVTANDVAGDPTRNMIYASVPGSASSYANSVVTIDGTSGKVTKSTFVGSEPNRMAVSDDGKYLYVALDGSSSVKRLVLPDMTEDFTVSLGADSFFGANTALDLAVSHVDSNVWASTSGNLGVSPAAQKGVVVYDGSVARPKSAGRNSGFNCGCDLLLGAITFGADSNTIIGANNESTGFDMYVLTLDSTGVVNVKDYSGRFGSFSNSHIQYNPTTKYVYADAGMVVDPLTGNQIGRFNYSGVMAADAGLSAAFFVSYTSSSSTDGLITSFDLQKFTPLNTQKVGTIIGSPGRIVRWGVNGVGFNTISTSYNGSTTTKTGRIHIYSGSFVKP